MKTGKNRKVSIFTILIFVLCAMLFIYAIIAAVNVTIYIQSMIGYGQLSVESNLFDIVNYYMSSCVNYLIYIAILLSIWWVRPRLKIVEKVKAVEEVEEVEEVEDASVESDAEAEDAVEEDSAEEQKTADQPVENEAEDSAEKQ